MAPSGNLIPPPAPRPDRARWQRLVAGLSVAQDLDLPATERVFANAWNRPVAPPKGGRPKRAPLLRVPLASTPGTRGQVLRPAGAATPASARLRAAVSPAMLAAMGAGPGDELDLGTWYPPGSAKCEDFVYRDVAFCIPTSFITGYQSAAAEQLEDSGGARAFGPVSSTSETLSALWSEFLDALDGAGGNRNFILNPETLGASPWNRLRGCWSIPDDGSASYLWTFRAHGAGAQALFFNTMCCLPIATSAYIDDVTRVGIETDSGWHGWCTGFGAFAREMLLTGSGVGRAPSTGGAGPAVSVHINATEPGNPDPDCRYNRDPRSDDDGCLAPPWYWWNLLWIPDPAVWQIRGISGWSFGGGVTYHSGRSPNWAVQPSHGTGCFGYARSYGDHIYFHAADIAAQATIVDRILWLARLARDFFLHGGGGPRYLLVAKQLASYALRYVLEQSRTLVHELGHKYLGRYAGESDQHCEAGCCYDAAAQNFACHTIGALGLPLLPHCPPRSSLNATGFVTARADYPSPVQEDWWIYVGASAGSDNPADVSYLDRRVHVDSTAPRVRCETDSVCAVARVGIVGAGAAYCVTDSLCSQLRPVVSYNATVIDFDYSSTAPWCSTL